MRRVDASASEADSIMLKDPSSLTATEHATTLVMQTIGEGLKQSAANAKALKAFEDAGEVQPLPAYEAPDELNSRAQGWPGQASTRLAGDALFQRIAWTASFTHTPALSR